MSMRVQQCIRTLALNYQNTMCLVRATRSPCNGNLFLVGGRSERDFTTDEKEKNSLGRSKASAILRKSVGVKSLKLSDHSIPIVDGA